MHFLTELLPSIGLDCTLAATFPLFLFLPSLVQGPGPFGIRKLLVLEKVEREEEKSKGQE